MAILVMNAEAHGVTQTFIGGVLDNQYSNSLTSRPFPQVSSSEIIAPQTPGANINPGGRGH